MPTVTGGDRAAKALIKIACCMPKQNYDRETKLEWLNNALGETDCDLFLTPQEFLGGHYIMPNDLHMDRGWVIETVGKMAAKHGKHIAIGACCKTPTTGATEDLLYLDDTGALLGYHSKWALPAYDDVRAGGHGQLWPETSFSKRATPIDVPKLRLRVGTIFCWECYNQMLWPAYSLGGVNLITHPIKFAPRGWLINKVQEDGKKHIVDFGNAPKSNVWQDRLMMASRHQVFCPIAISCNSWNLGPKFMALTGHVDEMTKTTQMLDIPALGGKEHTHTFQMLPERYTGLDHHHSAGAWVAHTGSIDGFQEAGEHTMHGKIRRLESHLIGDTTRIDCVLKAAALSRQKKSSTQRAFGKVQRVRLPKRSS